MDKTYHEHEVRLNARVHETYKAGCITTDTFLMRLGTNIDELAKDGKVAKNSRDISLNKAIKRAMASKMRGREGNMLRPHSFHKDPSRQSDGTRRLASSQRTWMPPTTKKFEICSKVEMPKVPKTGNSSSVH